jgi:hypothetical protein
MVTRVRYAGFARRVPTPVPTSDLARAGNAPAGAAATPTARRPLRATVEQRRYGADELEAGELAARAREILARFERADGDGPT